MVDAAEAAPDGLHALPIVTEPLVVAVPADHPLSRARRVTPAEVAAHPMACLPEGTGVRTVFDRCCAGRGLRPVIALQASAPDAVADLAARGLGVAVLTASMAERHGDRLRARPIVDADLPAVVALVWAADENPAVRALLTHARRTFGLHGDSHGPGQSARPTAA